MTKSFPNKYYLIYNYIIMPLNGQITTVLAIGTILFLVFLLYKWTYVQNQFSETKHNEENVNLPENIEEVEGFNSELKQNNKEDQLEEDKDNQECQNYSSSDSNWLKKFNSRNKAKKGQYKRSSYSGGIRGNLGPNEWQTYFDTNNNVIGNSHSKYNDKFLPIDESGSSFAIFKSKGRETCGSNQNCEPEDLYDVDKYLPQEVNDDWFEVIPEPISVKNRHLINITKPIGINTIGTSLRNASHDIRGTPASPKFVISPWLNSSIEPDTNLKQLC